MTETEQPAAAVPAQPTEPPATGGMASASGSISVSPSVLASVSPDGAVLTPGEMVPPSDDVVVVAVPDRGREARWAWAVVGLIAAIAGVAYGWGANSDGVEMYYAGAVRTMSHSWRAFFFGGFDPSGAVTLDKLPGSFWIQALVVRAFGLHTWCFIAPQIAAGVGTVLVMFVAVRRLAGPRTGILAAVVTAALPATAVMSRGNTADAVAVLLMVVAAAAAIKAIRTGRIRTLIVAGVWIGLAFQSKMIEAWAIAPALGVTYILAAPGSFRRRCRHAVVAGVVAVAVSLTWMTAVTLTPAADRPYVDGSTSNSVFQQVFEYNGLHRFDRTGIYGLTTVDYKPTTFSVDYTHDVYDRQIPQASDSDPGVFRLVRGPIGRDVGWLLPLALVCLIALLIALRRRPRTDLVRAGALLWGMWLVVFVVLFSDGTELQSYYTGVLVPPIAALSALGGRTLYRSVRKRPPGKLTSIGYVLAIVATVAVMPLLLRAAPTGFTYVAVAALALAGIGVVVTWAGGAGLRRAGVLAIVAALLVAPVLASTILVAGQGGSFDAPLTPGGTIFQRAGSFDPGTESEPPPTYGGVVFPELNAELWASFRDVAAYYAEPKFAGERVVVFTSAEASEYVAAGIPVEVIGGFSGLIASPTVDQLRDQLALHEIGIAIVPGAGYELSADPRIQLIEGACTRINGADPDTMGAQQYDCRIG
jgi:4-amino-4-deoxy-L-arabinose transferase-like glycosyltransferase